MIRGFEMEKCDCASFIEDKKREATQAITSYGETIEETNELIKDLKKLKEKVKTDYQHKSNNSFLGDVNADKTFKGRRLNDFISQLESRRSDAITSKHKEEDYLLLYNE